MLYMVEMDFTEPARQAAWDAWYLHHLHVLLSVPGFHTAQRFLCTLPHAAPYLAVYSVDSAQVFDSDAYRARGGRDSTGEWKSSMVSWDRNLFSGIDRAPAVSDGESLLMTEDARATASCTEIAFSWLGPAGLDCTVAQRAIAVAQASQAHRVAQTSGGRIRAYRPLMAQRAAGA
jgi:hypothetical protein